ncbi:hypothetical protein ACFQ0B_72125 [Nonomuraea thailandensis]
MPAQLAWPAGGAASQSGSRSSAQLTIPASASNRERQMTPCATGGTAQANMQPMTTNSDIFLPSRCSSTPTAVPRISVRLTPKKAKARLLRRADQKMSLDRTFSKFSSPTHSAGLVPLTCASPTFWNDMMPSWTIG